MDAGGLHPLREAGSRPDNFQSDRFIPVRSGMDFEVAHQMLTQPRRQRERIDALLLLVEVLLQNRTRILAFNNRPRQPRLLLPSDQDDDGAVEAYSSDRRQSIGCTGAYSSGGLHPLREAGSRRDNFQSDRFIPVRSGMDFDVAHQMLTQPRRQRERIDALLRSDDAYQKLLVEVLLQNRTRILAFNNRPRVPVEGFFDVDGVCSSPPTKMMTAWRRHIPLTADRVLDATELLDDYSLNLLDWGRSNLISIALGCRVCLWDADKGSAAELMNVDEDKGPVTSVSWAPDRQHIAIGLNSSDIQLWDLSSHRLVKIRDLVGHSSWVLFLAQMGTEWHQLQVRRMKH